MSRSRNDGILNDHWIQVLALLSIVSGIFSIGSFGEFHRLWIPRFIPAASSAGQAQAPFRGPKNPGRWIVDPRSAPDADCSTVAEAVAQAAEGDEIVLRPGTYAETVQISKSVTLSGSGGLGDQVWLTSNGPQTILVTGGRVSINNINLDNTGAGEGRVLRVLKASLALKNIKIHAAGLAIQVSDSDIGITDVTIEAREALSVEGKSRVQLLHVTASTSGSAILASGAEVKLRAEGLDARSSEGSAIEASQSADLRVSDASLWHNAAAAVVVRSKATVRVSSSTLSDNRGCGVSIDDGVVSIENTTITRDRCGAGFPGPGTLEAHGSEFSELSLGSVAIKPGNETRVMIRGSRNAGLVIPDQNSAARPLPTGN